MRAPAPRPDYCKRRDIARAAKAVPCADCGIQYPHYVMEFDHVRGVKVKNIARMVNNRGLVPLLAEIAKCEVVCANCHAIRTHIRKSL